MKAAIFKEAGKLLEINDVDEPQIIGGTVKVKVLSAHIMSYLNEVFSADGSRIATPIPFIPGPAAIGIIEEMAADVFGLGVGQTVFCHPTYRSPANRIPDDTILIGLFGVGAASADLMNLYKNGAFAERAVYPAACVTPILENEKVDPDKLSALNLLTIAYGALLASGFRPSQTVIVNGATGNIGSCVVLLATIMGAAKVIAVGRESETLDSLQQIDRRVVAYKLLADREQNTKNIIALAEERNILIDAISANTPEPTMACIDALSEHGVALLVGGVRSDLVISHSTFFGNQLTIKGNFMYPNSVPAEVLRLVGSGLLDLDVFKVKKYRLDQINEAIAQAPNLKGLSYSVINP